MPGTEEEPQAFHCVSCDANVEDEPAGYIGNNHLRPFCDSCLGDSVIACHDCDEYMDTSRDECRRVGDNLICEGCRDENYFRCEHCDELMHSEDGHHVEDSDAYVCEYCHDQFPVCDGCDETVRSTREIPPDDDSLCDECARQTAEEVIIEIRDRDQEDDDYDEDEDEEILDNLVYLAIELNMFGAATRQWECSECENTLMGALPAGGVWEISHWLTSGSRVGRCRTCAGVSGLTGRVMSRGRNPNAYQVRSYSHKPTPQFKRTERDLEKRALHFGTEVEIEMFSSDDDRGIALTQIGEADQEHKLFYCKSDACIGNGFELVSHPFTFDWMTQHRDAFEGMFSLSKIMKGFEATSCGMHIHMSANAFTNLHLFKFMRWFYANKEYIRSLSRRPRGKLDSWASMKEPDKDKLLKYALDKKTSLGLGRAALSLGSRQTIECRIFRSTLSPTGYYGNIEFLQSLFDYTKNSGVKDTRFDPYIEFVQERGKSYKNFLNLNDTIRPVYEAEGE